jgi:hypothetical protein
VKGASGTKLLAVADPVFEAKDLRAQEGREHESQEVASVQTRPRRDLMSAMEKGELAGLRFDRLPSTGKLAKNLANLYEWGSDVYTCLAASKESLLGETVEKLDQYGEVVFSTRG